MKKTCFLINTSRGPIVNEKDLIKRDGINILEKRENGDKKWQRMDKD